MENIAILGATGSIGTSALDVIAQYPDRYHVRVLCANSNVKKLAQLASVWQPELVAVARDDLYKPLLEELAQLGVTRKTTRSFKPSSALQACCRALLPWEQASAC